MLRPLKREDAPALRAIAAMSEVSTWWGPLADDFPLADEPEATRFTILADGEIAGLAQFGEENDPD